MDYREARRPGDAVRVTIPARVAYDLGTLQKGIGTLMERLGHPRCFSGIDCRFQMERGFVIDEKAGIRAVGSTDPDDDPILPASIQASASLPGKVSYNIDLVRESVASIVGRLGCLACCSGFDITFRNELNFMVDEQARVHG